MQTATASVSNLEKNSVTTDVQVIFDSGSQRTYVDEALCDILKLSVIRSERIICSPVIRADLNNQNCKFVSKRCSHLQSLNLAEKSTDIFFYSLFNADLQYLQ